MTGELTAFDPAPVMAGLKDFQRATVAHASARLFDPEASGRFLVADETGLGKTMVARGVIANAIEHHLERGTGRIDIVYICSNGDIARQNIRRLNVVPGNDFVHASRLTMLPATLSHLQDQRLNFVSFTPGTSFSLRSSEGIIDERALVFSMLQRMWGDELPFDTAATRVFAGYANFDGFAASARAAEERDLDSSLLDGFAKELREHGGADFYKRQFVELREQFSSVTSQEDLGLTDELRRARRDLVGTLRQRLAHACVSALEPDLVILDEFQRFKQLFDPEDDAGALARAMFEFPDVAVLLLSATPYRMYTRAGEAEDHYADFLDTVGFLLNDDGLTETLRTDLTDFRTALLQLTPERFEDAAGAKLRVEETLRLVMSRTERLSASASQTGMVSDRRPPAIELTAGDARTYVAMDSVGRDTGQRGGAQYWEATPYPLSFLDGYKFSDAAHDRIAVNGEAFPDHVVDALRWPLEDVDRYRRTDPGNVRMRSLAADTVDRGMWRLLWLPPSLPYHQPGGPYLESDVGHVTKRLVFSSWAVVPRAIASYLSYDAERRQVADGDDGQARRLKDREWRQLGGRLAFTRSDGRLSGMPVLALLYPSVVLADLGDPLSLARRQGAMHAPLSLDVVLDTTRRRVQAELAPLVEAAAGAGGPVDQRWYWAAPFLLDAAAGVDVADWAGDSATAEAYLHGPEVSGGDVPDGEGLRLHLEEAARVAEVGVQGLGLGRPPSDLADVVAQLVLAGPAVAALRALHRADPALRGGDDARRAAGSAAWGFRSLFNDPAVTRMLMGEVSSHRGEDVYWRLVLQYSVDGGLQAVLDEWTHVLTDALQLANRPEQERRDALVEAYREALGTQTVTYKVHRFDRRPEGGYAVSDDRIRASFARRFGDDRSETAATVQSAANVRRAFNSPFWPFVLATTSAGQEGLDFHTYCHAIVHWNLPSNPVDLEQREGRVHRYKGHAVRRNVALRHRAAAIAGDGDPWEAMFDEAAGHRRPQDDELVPYWVFTAEGGATIERHVPALPLSREAARHEELRRTTAAYRLVFGQPRQEDLVAFLDGRSDGMDLDRLRIDLRPPRT